MVLRFTKKITPPLLNAHLAKNTSKKKCEILLNPPKKIHIYQYDETNKNYESSKDEMFHYWFEHFTCI